MYDDWNSVSRTVAEHVYACVFKQVRKTSFLWFEKALGEPENKNLAIFQASVHNVCFYKQCWHCLGGSGNLARTGLEVAGFYFSRICIKNTTFSLYFSN